MPNKWRTINSWAHKIRLRGRRILLAIEMMSSITEGSWRNPVWPSHSSCVTPADASTSISLKSRTSGMTTHTHTYIQTLQTVLRVDTLVRISRHRVDADKFRLSWSRILSRVGSLLVWVAGCHHDVTRWKKISSMLLNSLFYFILEVWGLIVIPSSYKLILRQDSLFTTTTLLVFILALFLWLGFITVDLLRSTSFWPRAGLTFDTGMSIGWLTVPRYFLQL